MIKDSIAVIPEIGYNPFQQTSNKARLWIRFYSNKFNLNIRYSDNGSEHRIGPYKLDGYFEQGGEKYGLEFHGCLYHGCPKCYTRNTFNTVLNKPMFIVYERHVKRVEYIKS